MVEQMRSGLTRYGTWQQDLRILRQSYEQLALAAGDAA